MSESDGDDTYLIKRKSKKSTKVPDTKKKLSDLKSSMPKGLILQEILILEKQLVFYSDSISRGAFEMGLNKNCSFNFI